MGHQLAILSTNTLVIPIAVVRVWEPDVSSKTGHIPIAVVRKRKWCKIGCDYGSNTSICGSSSRISFGERERRQAVK